MNGVETLEIKIIHFVRENFKAINCSLSLVLVSNEKNTFENSLIKATETLY